MLICLFSNIRTGKAVPIAVYTHTNTYFIVTKESRQANGMKYIQRYDVTTITDGRTQLQCLNRPAPHREPVKVPGSHATSPRAAQCQARLETLGMTSLMTSAGAPHPLTCPSECSEGIQTHWFSTAWAEHLASVIVMRVLTMLNTAEFPTNSAAWQDSLDELGMD